MHTAFFDMKQAHLAAVRFGRRETEAVGLTPARLDMLRTILEQPGMHVLQRKLRHFLGVSNAVVSIMIRALEALGFVKRTRAENDGRTFDVRLTGLAKRALRAVFFETVTMGFLELALVSAFVKHHVPRPGWERTLNRLQSRLGMFRRAFGIGTTSYNPWDANDDDESFYYDDHASNPNADTSAPIGDEPWGATQG